MATDKNMYFPDYFIAPGDIALEHLELFGWSVEEFAERCELDLDIVKGVIEGTAVITDDIACRFENVLGIKAYLWLRLELAFQEGLESGKIRIGQSETDDATQVPETFRFAVAN